MGVIFLKDKFISWDYGTDDCDCMVYRKYNRKGEIIIEKVKYSSEKEVKKVKPYLEVEVVKVSKGEKGKCGHSHLIQIQDLPNRLYQCANCGYYIYPPFKKNYLLVKGKVYKKQPKGNWVNGENLDKIKFPCFCSYTDKVTNVKCYAEINQGHDNNVKVYKLSRLFQADGDSIFYKDTSLEKLIINLSIHILKGKIIIWEEE